MSDIDNSDTGGKLSAARRLLPLAAVYVGRAQPKQGKPDGGLTAAESELLADAVKRLVFEAGELAVRKAPPPGGDAYKTWQPPATGERLNDVPSPSLAYIVSAVGAALGKATPMATEPVMMKAAIRRGPNEHARRVTAAYSTEAAPTNAAMAQTSTTSVRDRLIDCLVGVLCDFLRCVHDRLCTPDGLVSSEEWGQILRDCLEVAVCQILECLPEALCPPPDEPTCRPPCEPDALPCDYAVEAPRRQVVFTPRNSFQRFGRLVRS